METRDPKSAESANAGGAESQDPKSDATSSETLSEVEESEKVSETGEGAQGGADEKSSTPSPDGAFDEGRGGQGGVDDAGPM